MDFPYGKAPLAILIAAILSGAALLAVNISSSVRGRPDLIMATFTKEHAEAYRPAIKRFEEEHGVKIQLQVVDQRALQSRLQAALQADADVPDMVELLDGTMGIFTKGPIQDVGFIDLTQKVHDPDALPQLGGVSLYDALVTTRFVKWSSRGHIFALPHDVHPVMLAYRRDLVEQLGIDVSTLTTWDEFCRVGREVATKDLNGDGVPDRYMMDLPFDGGDALRLLILQRGGRIFDDDGRICYDNALTAEVICWYIRQIEGKDRIAFPCGWGQNLSRAMIDGLCLFYICPDWRTSQFQADVPSMKGKLGLMPLPAWQPGGKRTSTWGGTGLAFTKKCRDFDLAWKFAMFLYYDSHQLGSRFAATNILPPLKAAWNEPEFHQPREFWNGLVLGEIFTSLAPGVPAEYVSAYQNMAIGKMSEAYQNALLYYRQNGESGLREMVQAELRRTADQGRLVMNRNVFLQPEAAQLTKEPVR